MSIDLKNQSPHRRWNPLRQSWVLVSPHRTQRPWQGEVGQKATPSGVSYDPACYLCPGNERAGGTTNPPYEGVFSFVNDYAALMAPPASLPGADALRADALGAHASSATGETAVSKLGLLRAAPANGICKVLCYHPDHSLTLARMTQAEIRPVVEAWTEQFEELGGLSWIKYVQIFENRGAMMGASNPHPHGQIWTTDFIPDEPALETSAQREHLKLTGSCLLCSYLEAEEASASPSGEGRIVFENEHFVALVPWWAVWPFEVMLLSRRHAGTMRELSSDERDGLADALKRLTTRFDNLFETSFPYTMGFHQSPTDGQGHPEWHFHAHFYPPLLRSATVRKFMVGFEMLGMPQRDITPEEAARRLREAGEVHFWRRD
jgi:UDPglucose--hexose-1-phosphate uridylyltransferase